MKTIDLSKVDLSQLESEISNRLHFPIKFTAEVGRRKDEDEYLMLQSQELKDLAGIMSGMYERLRIDTFSSGISETGIYWMTINWSFEYKRGGSNGVQLCYAWYNPETKVWTIEF